MNLASTPSIPQNRTFGNIVNLFFERAYAAPDHPAFYVSKNEQHDNAVWEHITTAEWLEEIILVAKGLWAHGARPGMRMMLMANTQYNWTLVEMAGWAIGMVIVPVYPTLSTVQIAAILKETRPDFVFTDTANEHGKIENGFRAIPMPYERVRIWSLEQSFLELLKADGKTYCEQEACPTIPISQRDDDLATIVYTSGSTGIQKGVHINHENLTKIVYNVGTIYPKVVHDQARTVIVLPLAHIFSRIIQMVAITKGVEVSYLSDPDTLLSKLPDLRPTFICVVPRILEKVRDYLRKETKLQSREAFFGFAEQAAVDIGKYKESLLPKLDRDHYRVAVSEATAINGYGQASTENNANNGKSNGDTNGGNGGENDNGNGVGNGITSTNGVGKSNGNGKTNGRKNGRPSISLPLRTRLAAPFLDATVFRKIRNNFGGHVESLLCGAAPLDEDLAYLFRGMGIPIVQGYGLTETTGPITGNPFNAEKSGSVGIPVPGSTIKIGDNGEVLLKGLGVSSSFGKQDADGFIDSGDLGYLDHEGYLYITGRKKDVIITSWGKMFVPTKWEQDFCNASMVSYAQIVGENRPYFSALYLIDEPKLAQWAKNNGKTLQEIETYTVEGLGKVIRDKALRKDLSEITQQINANYSPADQVKRFEMIISPLLGHVMFTPTLKLRRHVLKSLAQPLVERMYTKRSHHD